LKFIENVNISHLAIKTIITSENIFRKKLRKKLKELKKITIFFMEICKFKTREKHAKQILMGLEEEEEDAQCELMLCRTKISNCVFTRFWFISKL